MTKLMYKLLCISFQLLLAMQLTAQADKITKEELIATFGFQEMSNAGVDTIFNNYVEYNAYLRPWKGQGIFATSDKPYSEKMKIIEEVMKPKMIEADYQLLVTYWEKSHANFQLRMEDIADRYGRYKACMKGIIDSLEAISQEELLSYSKEFLEGLTEKQLKDFKLDFKKYQDVNKRIAKQFSMGRDYINELDSIAYTSFQFTLLLPMHYPAVKKKWNNLRSNEYFSEMQSEAYFDLYQKFDLALGTAACNSCAVQANIGRPCYYTTSLENEQDSLTSKRNALYYALMNEVIDKNTTEVVLTDTIPYSYIAESKLDPNDIIDHEFYISKGYSLSRMGALGNEVIYQTGEEPFQLMVIELQQTKSKRLEVVPKLNEKIKSGIYEAYQYENETVYVSSEDGLLKGYIFMIVKEGEMIALGIMDERITDPKKWFEAHRSGIKL